MITGQYGIFALGDAAHGFFEFALRVGADPVSVAKAIESVLGPRSTTGGVNRVVGFRPSLWQKIAPDDAPGSVRDFEEVRGAGGYTMPATQADVWIWFAAASYDVVFDLGRQAVDSLRGLATLVREERGWAYRHNRDLTGFEDGTKNPELDAAPEVALIEDGQPGAGGSVLLFQRWRHDGQAFVDLPLRKQEDVIGRTKPDSIELDEAHMPADSHVQRTTVTIDGSERKIFRRNVPYGTVADHGTLFIGFSADQVRLQRMLEQMAGIGGPRDALTLYTTPLTGAYYFVPSVQSLSRFAPPPDPD